MSEQEHTGEPMVHFLKPTVPADVLETELRTETAT